MNIGRALRQLQRSVGLQPMGMSDYVLPAAGIFAVGALAGAGVTLLFAPSARQKILEQFGEYRSRFMLESDANHASSHNNHGIRQPESVPRV